MKQLKQYVLKRINSLVYATGIQELHDVIVYSKFQQIQKGSGNTLLQGSCYPGFSQVDEDSIIREILVYIEEFKPLTSPRDFVELGVGDGTQNNTLALLMSGWKGLWFGGEDLAIELTPQLKFDKVWITLDSLKNRVIPEILKLQNLKVLSLDLDGNDYWIAKELLANNVQPDIWVQEYNSLFPPHVKWVMPYNENHVCKYDGYWGASLSAFVDLFELNGYFLVACNVSGVNAFFVKEKFKDKFIGIPSDIDQLYMPNRAWLYKSKRKLSNQILHGLDPTKSKT